MACFLIALSASGSGIVPRTTDWVPPINHQLRICPRDFLEQCFSQLRLPDMSRFVASLQKQTTTATFSISPPIPDSLYSCGRQCYTQSSSTETADFFLFHMPGYAGFLSQPTVVSGLPFFILFYIHNFNSSLSCPKCLLLL